ncbi:MAG TPA: hypothetical protein VHE23_04465 [Candidatus Acidoferrales bacterium]|nr:hypothetical protein [Candidatus Acidoferrales bacterium]
MRRGPFYCALFLFLTAGCQKHLLTDYRPLDQAGMWFDSVQELRALNADDAEVAQLVKLKQASISDDTCVKLISAAHIRKHNFASADAVLNLYRGGFSEAEILDLASTDRIDALSLDAVTLRLTGLSTAVVLEVLHRRVRGLPALSGPVIGRLKNTGLTEAQILERIKQGMTDAQGEREAVVREHARNKTGFVRNSGRRR